MKDSFIKISDHLFSNFKNKQEIVQKIKEMRLSAKTVKDRTIKMAENITFSIARDELSDVNDVEQLCYAHVSTPMGRRKNSYR